MNRLPLPVLFLPERWKARTRVFVEHKRSVGVLAPMVSREIYAADRARAARNVSKVFDSSARARPDPQEHD
jgi:hypothetical protein